MITMPLLSGKLSFLGILLCRIVFVKPQAFYRAGVITACNTVILSC